MNGFTVEPTPTMPIGIYGAGAGQADIISIMKLDSNGQLMKNEIVLAELDEINESNKDFIKNVFLSDETVKDANKNNYGFVGSIVTKEGQPEEYMIERNKPGYSDLVTGIALAYDTKGTMYADNLQCNLTFENMKKVILSGFQKSVLKEYEQSFLEFLKEIGKNRSKEKGKSRDE